MTGRIWIVSELYYPEDTSTGYFLTGIAEGLARRHDVSALCSQPTYSERGVRAPSRERHNGVDIHRCKASTFDRRRFWPRLANLLTISASMFVMALKMFRRNDLVLVVTNPPLLPFLVQLACRVRGARCMLLVHDVYPDVLIAAGMTRRGSWMEKVVAWVSTRMYRRMNCIIAIGRDMRDLIAEKLAPCEGRSRIVIIENWGDVQGIVPSDRADNRLLQRLRCEGKFVVQYCGNIGRTHAIDCLVEAAKALRDHADIMFVIIGQGAKEPWLRQTLRTEDLSNVVVLPRRPRDELGVTLSACHLAVIPFICGMAGLSVPSRMYNSLAAGRPLLAAAEGHSEIARLIRDEGVGWVVPSGDAAALARAVLEAKRDPKRLAEMGLRARAVAEAKYSYARIIERYEALVEEVGQ